MTRASAFCLGFLLGSLFASFVLVYVRGFHP